MVIPEEFELISVFESQPVLLDGPEVPFFYNQATYKLRNINNERFTIKLSPSYDEIEISVFNDNHQIANLAFKQVRELTILSEKINESRIMLTRDNSLIKIDLKPKFTIFFVEDIE